MGERRVYQRVKTDDRVNQGLRCRPMKTKSALSWFGSDSEVAADLAALLDHCKHVTIPFVGGASILPHLKARAIVANDLNDMAIEFYRVMSGEYGDVARDDLIARCSHTLSHPSELKRAAEFLSERSPVRRAWAYWAICSIGRKGQGGTTRQANGMPSVRRTATGGMNSSRIRSAADDLEAWAKEFERCEWECLDFRDLIPKIADDPQCGVYVDAPWIGAGDKYLHKFELPDHCDLAALLHRFEETTVVVRYGDGPLIRDLYRGWHLIEASARTQANAQLKEIWLVGNHPDYDPIPRQIEANQESLF